ncbi:PREDICTED: keratin-associated protein 12-2-like [Cariama cristata]|uniref:keratin-associated protein 12-2-like n=1 Tax=Cariama cristata TaxID=54380 RepID=UPI000520B354|nr:PREDICTED: keratin-associated protein 12-2-like [Cariama cristata]
MCAALEPAASALPGSPRSYCPCRNIGVLLPAAGTPCPEPPPAGPAPPALHMAMHHCASLCIAVHCRASPCTTVHHCIAVHCRASPCTTVHHSASLCITMHHCASLCIAVHCRA